MYKILYCVNCGGQEVIEMVFQMAILSDAELYRAMWCRRTGSIEGRGYYIVYVYYKITGIDQYNGMQ